MTVGFGPEKEVFKYSAFIVFFNRIITCIVAASILLIYDLPLKPNAPVLFFAIPSVANVISSTAQYEALKYVNFPMQALAKCAKSIPVMAWSWITRTRHYQPSDYLSAALVTFGCALFVLTGDITAPTLGMTTGTALQTGSVLSFTTVGISLLAVFMVFDGLTCTSQEKLFSSYEMHSCSQLLYTCGWSAALSFSFLAASGQLLDALRFLSIHPDCLWLIFMQSVISTTVQIFISFTIKLYGALNFALMMTMRQFLSIAFSCLVFQHELSFIQWTGIAVTISGLTTKSMNSKHKKHQNIITNNTASSPDTQYLLPKHYIPPPSSTQLDADVLDGISTATYSATTMNNNNNTEKYSFANDDSEQIPLLVENTPRTAKYYSTNGSVYDRENILSSPTPRSANHLNSVHPFGNVFGNPLVRNALSRQVSGVDVSKEKPG